MHHVRRVLLKPASPRIGSVQLLQRSLVDLTKLPGLLVIGICMMLATPCGPKNSRLSSIVGDAIPDSLTGTKGDPAVGRKIVVSRQSTCLLCHSGPFPEERFQGDVGPD